MDMNGTTTYIWQQEDWPHMTWDHACFSNTLAEVNMLRGKLLGRVSMFGFEEQNQSMLDSLTQEIVHSAKIEGEELNRDSVRSSVARQLGLEYEGLPVPDHYTEGVVQVMMDAVQHYAMPLDEERLFSWHAALFPTGRSGIHKIDVAHLWFVTIHPFDDGNGRLCRTLTELLLSRADQTYQRYYSLSSEILNHRKEYYDHLEQAQKGILDITPWIQWFLQTLKLALEHALQKTENVVREAQFWDKHRTVSFNDRQRKVLNMLFDGFEGKLNSSKWYKINHCSQDTANRDINDLMVKGVLRQANEGGRSTNYELNEE